MALTSVLSTTKRSKCPISYHHIKSVTAHHHGAGGAAGRPPSNCTRQFGHLSCTAMQNSSTAAKDSSLLSRGFLLPCKPPHRARRWVELVPTTGKLLMLMVNYSHPLVVDCPAPQPYIRKYKPCASKSGSLPQQLRKAQQVSRSPRRAVAEGAHKVELVLNQALGIGAVVDGGRQRVLWVEPAARDIKLDLAQRDAMAIHACDSLQSNTLYTKTHACLYSSSLNPEVSGAHPWCNQAF